MQGQHLSFHLLSNITVCTVSGLKRILIAVLFPRNLHLLLSGGQTVYKQIIMFVTGDTRDRAATYYRESSASLSSSDEFLLNSGAHLSHPSFSWCIMQSHLIHLLFISAYIVHLFQTKHHCCWWKHLTRCFQRDFSGEWWSWHRVFKTTNVEAFMNLV